jgi:hypothetical protein
MTWADTWKNVRRVAAFIGLAAAAVGLIGSWLSLQEIAAKRREQAALEWQEPEVYRLIAASGTGGTSFSNLLKEFKVEGLTASVEIPKAKLDEFALRRILIELIDKKVIVVVGIDTYRVFADSDLCTNSHSLGEIQGKLAGKALTYLSSENGTRTQAQVIEHFRTAFGLEYGESQFLVISMLQSGWIGVHPKTQHVWNLILNPEKVREFADAANPAATPDDTSKVRGNPPEKAPQVTRPQPGPKT